MHLNDKSLTLTFRLSDINNYIFDKLGVNSETEKELWVKMGVIEYGLPQSISLAHPINGIGVIINADKILDCDDVYKRIASLVEMWYFGSRNLSRQKRIVEIFCNSQIELEQAKKTRSNNLLQNVCYKHVPRTIRDNRWDIMSVDILFNMVDWCKDYVTHGSPYAIAMLSRLKAMTHKKDPIYSVKGS